MADDAMKLRDQMLRELLEDPQTPEWVRKSHASGDLNVNAQSADIRDEEQVTRMAITTMGEMRGAGVSPEETLQLLLALCMGWAAATGRTKDDAVDFAERILDRWRREAEEAKG